MKYEEYKISIYLSFCLFAFYLPTLIRCKKKKNICKNARVDIIVRITCHKKDARRKW